MSLFYFTSCVLNLFRTLIYPTSACKTSTTQNEPHQISNTQRTENNTTDFVIQQHSRKLLMMDILMSETCWVHKKWNKISSDIKLVFHSSTITMMHGPINIRFTGLAVQIQPETWIYVHISCIVFVCCICEYTTSHWDIVRGVVSSIWKDKSFSYLLHSEY